MWFPPSAASPNGFPREDGFDITVASEVMAIFCLSRNLDELRARLGNIVVGLTREREPVRASAVNADGAMTALLKDALAPNLVQTLENNPALIHGGPFANIAHGCNSVIATRAALKLADYVVTEAGFGADLGAEKFFDIKCRKAGLAPDCAVIVATIRALKMHGGVARKDLGAENLEALADGMANLARHVRNVQGYDVPAVVAINRFSADTEAERALVAEACAEMSVKAVECDHWAMGGAGCEALAHEVVGTIEATPSSFQPLYPDELTLWEKIETVAKRIYGADGISADAKVRKQLDDLQAGGFGHFPVCMAKTQYSFSADAALKNAPSGFEVPIPRGQAFGRRRVRGGGLRRDHDHARPAPRPRRRQHRRQRRGAHHRAVLVRDLTGLNRKGFSRTIFLAHTVCCKGDTSARQ